MRVHDGGYGSEFSEPFSAFLSINDKAISSPSQEEAQLFQKQKVENGSLDVSVNLRFPNSDYGTLHISFYAYGIGIDDTRIAHLTVFVQDVTEAIASEDPAPHQCSKKGVKESCSRSCYFRLFMCMTNRSTVS